MAIIGNLAVMISANAAPANRAFNAFADKVQGLGGGVDGLLGKVASFGGVIAAVAGAAGMGALIHSSIESLSALQDLSTELGVTTTALAGLQHAAELSGVDAELMGKSLAKMANGISEVAATGKGGAAAAIDELGLSIDKLRTLGVDQQFMAITTAMAGVENQSDKIRISMDLFGKSGPKILNVMTGGVEGLNAALEDAKSLGLAPDPADVALVESLGDNVDRVGKSFLGLANTVTVRLAPVINELATSFIAFMPLVISFADRMTSMVAAIAGPIVHIVSGITEWRDALALVIPAIVGMVTAMATIVTVQKAIAVAQTAILALAGPAGWAVLAGAAVVGAAAFIAVDKSMAGVEATARAATAEVQKLGNASGEAARKAAQLEASQKRVAEALKTAKDRFRTLSDEVQVLGAPEAMRPFVEIGQELRKLQEAGAPAQAVAAVRAMLLEKQRLLEIDKLQAAEEERIKKATQEQADLEKRQAEEEKNRVKGLEDRAKQLLEDMKTPFEKLQDKFKEIQDLFAEGIISKDQMKKLIAFNQQKFEEDTAAGGKFNGKQLGEIAATGNIQQGTSEAFSSVFAAMRNNGASNPMQAMAKDSAKQTENSVKIANSTKATATAVTKLEAKMPVIVAGKV